jgi:hypothetical protein
VEVLAGIDTDVDREARANGAFWSGVMARLSRDYRLASRV